MGNEKKSIYDLELNETLVSCDYIIRRVPGGWVYTEYDGANSQNICIMSSVFVPFHNEFQ